MLGNLLKRYKVIMLLASFLITFLIGIVSYNKTQSQKSYENMSSITPREVVQLYWSSSFYGDEEMVQELLTSLPNSFYEYCPNHKDNTTFNESRVSQRKTALYKKLENSYYKIKSYFFTEPFTTRNNLSLEHKAIFFMSKSIYLNKEAFSNYEIKEEINYNNEAIIKVGRIENTEKSAIQFFALKKESSGWKIFKIVSDINYHLVEISKSGEKRLCPK